MDKIYIIYFIIIVSISMSIGMIVGASYQYISDENLIDDIARDNKILKTSKDSYSIRIYTIEDINSSMISEDYKQCLTI